jgi:hypothetical protein
MFARRLLLLLALGAPLAPAEPTISVYPAVAPNQWGSLYYNGWVGNAISALENGLTSSGDPGLPSHYQQQSSITGSEILVTSFPSWMGNADPATHFGPAFANELGNRPLFGLVIQGNGTRFSLANLSFAATSTDPGDSLGFSFGAGSYGYGPDYVGIILGAGGPTYVASGPNTQTVDVLVGRGSGNALWPCGTGDPLPCTTVAEQQAALDWWAHSGGSNWSFTGTYTLGDGNGGTLATGSGTFDITSAPEASTPLLVAGGVLVLLGLSRRRRS